MRGQERRGKGEERRRKRKKRACMSSQAGSVRPLCHVSLPQPLHTHTHTGTHTHTHTHTHTFCSHDGHVLSVTHPLFLSLTHTPTATSHTLISPLSSCRIIRTKVQQPPGQTGSVSAHNLGRSQLYIYIKKKTWIQLSKQILQQSRFSCESLRIGSWNNKAHWNSGPRLIEKTRCEVLRAGVFCAWTRWWRYREMKRSELKFAKEMPALRNIFFIRTFRFCQIGRVCFGELRARVTVGDWSEGCNTDVQTLKLRTFQLYISYLFFSPSFYQEVPLLLIISATWLR